MVRQETSGPPRSLFEVHKLSNLFSDILTGPAITERARQILGSDVYLHQSRVNFKPGFGGGDFYWHSDFETWHAEDGFPEPRALSVSISLTDNHTWNGPLMVCPGSHMHFIQCKGHTPDSFHTESLTQLRPQTGVPDTASITALIDQYGIHEITGPAGSAVFFDANILHGSNGNITPHDRANIFAIYNSTQNLPVRPYAAPHWRPDYLAHRPS